MPDDMMAYVVPIVRVPIVEVVTDATLGCLLGDALTMKTLARRPLRLYGLKVTILIMSLYF